MHLRATALVILVCSQGCGAAPPQRWIRYESQVNPGEYERHVPAELRFITLQGARFVQEIYDADMHGEEGTTVVCYEQVEYSPPTGEFTEVVIASIIDVEMRAYLWRGILVLETADGRVYPYRSCGDDCPATDGDLRGVDLSAVPSCAAIGIESSSRLAEDAQ